MFEHRKIQSLNDFFTELSKRREKAVYFYRINGCNAQILEFIQRYYEAARLSGVVIEGKIPNPDEKNLSYYNEIMGMSFQMSPGFITSSLKRWLPRMNDYQRTQVAQSMYDCLENLRKAGKNENILKNAYIKFMCWLYYKFERIVSQLGENKIPKILYEGEVSRYELMLLEILSGTGCDIVLLQYRPSGEKNYFSLDPQSKVSDNLALSGMNPFPESFSLKKVREEMAEKRNRERLYGVEPQIRNCTNAWIEGKGLDDIRTAVRARGDDPKLFYNCFCRIYGVEDKLTYMNELYQFQMELRNSKRNLLIVEQSIPQPSPDEIASIRRGTYTREDQMMQDLSSNIKYTADIELQRLMKKVFLDLLSEVSRQPGMTLNRLTNRAVYLLCWLRRYQKELFSGWKMPDIACFIYLGGCKNENEALFLRLLARLPVDVLILNPNLDTTCCLQDSLLYERSFSSSLAVSRFPRANTDVHIGTAAYHAERELDSVLYQDSGLYRNQQYKKAATVTLQTMYEELAILWDQELKYRPSFSTMDDVVTLPVMFAKVSGVKDGNLSAYWAGIKGLLTEDTILIKGVPYLDKDDPNPIKPYVTAFYKNRKLQRRAIREHPNYPYGVLREEMQNHLLDKLQLLIESGLIKGTFENGTEYMILATALNLQKNVVRLIQKFDFTKKNPKIVYINTTDRVISQEDAIMMAYLNLVGFDIVFFVPTGYQTVEKYYTRRLMEEYQIGEYLYDLRVPDFSALSSSYGTLQSLRDRLFGRR